MRIAVPTDDGTSVSPHFGRSAGFLVFEVEEGRIKGREMRSNQMRHSHEQGACSHESGGSEPPSHAGIVAALAGCHVVICAGMGWRAAEALKSAGIAEIRFATPGPAEETVAAFLAGDLPAADQRFCRCSH
ncbi:MAG: iron-molybdenum cofactor biosynthesis protein [Acidobacteriia bacterium]|nr:iron-molybdenum cofactor biosynthesis protein [Terriglobia bacterium]